MTGFLEGVFWIAAAAAVLWWILRQRTPKVQESPHRPGAVVGSIRGPGQFRCEVAGESHYQDALERIAGPRGEEPKRHQCRATLHLEPSNAFDPNAVRVEIDNRTVGYLPKQLAPKYGQQIRAQGLEGATLTVDALIVGGWDRGKGNAGHFGARLDIPIIET